MPPINLDADAGAENAERIPDGEYVGEIVRIFTTSQGGGPLRTKKGDRKFKVVISDGFNHECWYEAMVEGPALFKAARLLKHAGYSSDELEEAGINDYADFLDQRTAERFLLNKRVRIKVSTRVDRETGKEYPDLETLPQSDAAPVKETKVRPAKAKAEQVAPREDVPF